MTKQLFLVGFSGVGLLLMVFGGCLGRGPARVRPPSIDAGSAGREAIRQYDTNADGLVKGEELDKAPSLKAALKKLDKNGDGGVDASEVTARIRQWQESKVGKMGVSCIVTFNKRPLAGAKVTFEPEKFLGANMKICVGTTDDHGAASLIEEASSDGLPGCPPGLYLVRISKQEGGKELLPAKYNSQTILGVEIALDAEGMQEGSLRFDLMP
ncbi:MAG: hypothetical protein NZ602_14335 [Thermoguttaceae bacterium]|nr:hypothetical protein [Thermoguttaceae bacterium]MDW8037347.1 hypothetical protein [Thermoguttaceae bacterium]